MAEIISDFKNGAPVIARGTEFVDNKVALLHDKKRSTKMLVEVSEKTLPYIAFANTIGAYVIKSQYTEDELFYLMNTMGTGSFPYTFERRYEAMDSFNLFNGHEVIEKDIEFELAKFMPYTFGIEYETSMGYIPQDVCFRNGLIPLRDGSISGLEYSTTVMQGNDGLNLVYQQLEALRKFTYFNKECSLHVHMGGYPIDPMAIYALYRVCYFLQEEMAEFLPDWTFETSKYKKSGKDYCHKLANYKTFGELYKNIAQQKFMGSLEQPHPRDEERSHKWDCTSRYTCVNLLNLMCYDKCKTVEFRFLRPTYNFKKIYYWLAIFNAILKYSEDLFAKSDKTEKGIEQLIYDDNTSIYLIASSVYPKPLADKIEDFVNKLYVAVGNQRTNGDLYGKDTAIEDTIIGTRL